MAENSNSKAPQATKVCPFCGREHESEIQGLANKGTQAFGSLRHDTLPRYVRESGF